MDSTSVASLCSGDVRTECNVSTYLVSAHAEHYYISPALHIPVSFFQLPAPLVAQQRKAEPLFREPDNVFDGLQDALG